MITTKVPYVKPIYPKDYWVAPNQEPTPIDWEDIKESFAGTALGEDTPSPKIHTLPDFYIGDTVFIGMPLEPTDSYKDEDCTLKF